MILKKKKKVASKKKTHGIQTAGTSNGIFYLTTDHHVYFLNEQEGKRVKVARSWKEIDEVIGALRRLKVAMAYLPKEKK